MFTFFTLLILVKLLKSIEVDIIYFGLGRGGLMLVEVEVFSGVEEGGDFFQRNLISYSGVDN